MLSRNGLISHSMPNPDTKNPYQLHLAELNWQEAGVPVANQYDDIYFSTQHGLEETRHVFLQHNQLAERWQTLQKNQFTIAETGFGTGLNFLAACQLWQQSGPNTHAQLHFISAEKHPLSHKDLSRALASWPELERWANELLAQYPVLTPGHHRLDFAGGIHLHLLLGDALECFEQLRHSHLPEYRHPPGFAVDAWFLDGFAPSKNPDLWSQELLSMIAQLSRKGTTLATFTAVGEVRRQLSTFGFNMQKVKGFGHKREMLKGHFIEYPANSSSPQITPSAPENKTPKTAWYINGSHPMAKNRHVAVIGAGLAGCFTAYAMARRGWRVSLIDSQPAPAMGASGNPQGMLYTSLSPESGLLNQFHLSSYLYALRLYRRLLAQQLIPEDAIHFCGLLQLAHSEKLTLLLPKLKSTFSQLPELVSFHSPESASKLAGFDLDLPGWFFPQSGWASPAQLCKSLATHHAIELLSECPIREIVRENDSWQLRDDRGQQRCESEVVVIANSYHSMKLEQTSNLPLKTIRGQVTELATNPLTHSISCVICHEGYITPAYAGHHHLGATFDLNNQRQQVTAEDHTRNLQSLNRALPQLKASDIDQLGGWAGVRCASPDYLPLVGPLHQHKQFQQRYAQLAKNAHAAISTAGNYYPGLYLNVAHGSRGLTTAPLCAELLAATINQEPPPLPRRLLTALNPARFTIRDILRGKVLK